MDEDERARRWRNAIDDLRVDKPNYDKYSIALGLLADAERERDRFLTRAAQERERADNIEAERDAARAEVARLREALEWYADPQTYRIEGRAVSFRPHASDPNCVAAWDTDWIQPDAGARARAALAATAPKEGE